ncbi:MAG: 16S rRNA (cytosine(1402)-N(4))-methyltransferase RsmH [Verrucomicrobiota bacterium]|nr:16S rRNA (cytosine(1402)-N(4))-methyltransferase RsmH [Verrucomicrobiota bacterium]
MTGHLPVLLAEVLQVLQPRDGGRYLDATFGGGGHSAAILEATATGQLTALDCDPEAAARVDSLRASFGERLSFHGINFRDIGTIPEGPFDGILFDLGVSSFQLDDPQRGFSFRAGGPTDMRLNPREGLSAALFLETAPREDLIRAVRDYGEEQSWRRVVDTIMQARGSGTLSDTASLAALVSSVVRKTYGRSTIHPATLTFQGIRLAVNEELASLEAALPAAFEKLAPGGVLAVISFHSLEDRLVKRFFRRMAGMPEHENDSAPQQSRTVRAQLITKRPIGPTEEEVKLNPRARSSRLRALRKEAKA